MLILHLNRKIELRLAKQYYLKVKKIKKDYHFPTSPSGRF